MRATVTRTLLPSLPEEVFPHSAVVYFHLQQSSWTVSAAVLLNKELYSRFGHLLRV